MAQTATLGSLVFANPRLWLRLGSGIRKEDIENLVATHHPEILARDSLLRGGVGADQLLAARQRVYYARKRITARSKLPYATMLSRDVERAVLPALKREYNGAQDQRTPNQPCQHPRCLLQTVQRRAGKLGQITKFFLDAKQLIVLRNAIGAAR